MAAAVAARIASGELEDVRNVRVGSEAFYGKKGTQPSLPPPLKAAGPRTLSHSPSWASNGHSNRPSARQEAAGPETSTQASRTDSEHKRQGGQEPASAIRWADERSQGSEGDGHPHAGASGTRHDEHGGERSSRLMHRIPTAPRLTVSRDSNRSSAGRQSQQEHDMEEERLHGSGSPGAYSDADGYSEGRTGTAGSLSASFESDPEWAERRHRQQPSRPAAAPHRPVARVVRQEYIAPAPPQSRSDDEQAGGFDADVTGQADQPPQRELGSRGKPRRSRLYRGGDEGGEEEAAAGNDSVSNPNDTSHMFIPPPPAATSGVRGINSRGSSTASSRPLSSSASSAADELSHSRASKGSSSIGWHGDGYRATVTRTQSERRPKHAQTLPAGSNATTTSVRGAAMRSGSQQQQGQPPRARSSSGVRGASTASPTYLPDDEDDGMAPAESPGVPRSVGRFAPSDVIAMLVDDDDAVQGSSASQQHPPPPPPGHPRTHTATPPRRGTATEAGSSAGNARPRDPQRSQMVDAFAGIDRGNASSRPPRRQAPTAVSAASRRNRAAQSSPVTRVELPPVVETAETPESPGAGPSTRLVRSNGVAANSEEDSSGGLLQEALQGEDTSVLDVSAWQRGSSTGLTPSASGSVRSLFGTSSRARRGRRSVTTVSSDGTEQAAALEEGGDVLLPLRSDYVVPLQGFAVAVSPSNLTDEQRAAVQGQEPARPLFASVRVGKLPSGEPATAV